MAQSSGQKKLKQQREEYARRRLRYDLSAATTELKKQFHLSTQTVCRIRREVEVQEMKAARHHA